MFTKLKPLWLVCSALLMVVTGVAKAECTAVANCDELWVVAQDAGIPLAFFGKVIDPRDVKDLRICDTLVSEHNINIRRRAHDFSTNLGLLPIGTQVVVEDFKKVTVPGEGQQVWLRITVDPEAVRTKKREKDTVVSERPASSGGTGNLGTVDPTTKKVINCYTAQVYGGKSTTIRAVFECSGYWVTPRALLACGLETTRCPVLPDTTEGRAILASTLKGLNITVDSDLLLDPKSVPRLPDNSDILNCRSSSKSDDEFARCTSAAIFQKYQTQVNCFKKLTDGEKLACFSGRAANSDFTGLIGCLNGGRPTLNKVATCVTKPDLQAKITQVRECIADAADDETATACLSASLTAQQQDLAKCLANIKGTRESAACLDHLSPEIRRARQVSACLARETSDAVMSACILTQLGGSGDSARIATCLASDQDRLNSVVCILGDTPQTQALRQVYRCIQGGRDAGSLVASCTTGILDDKSRQTMSCVVRAGDDRAQLAGCAASAVLPPEAARIVGCASSSEGPTSFALCAAAPSMNEEWRIAAECAVQSGGNPVSFTGCTAGRLTARELIKCFQGEIGKDCFGPNNTMIVTLTNSFNDLTKGPGKNNEIVKALQSVGDLTGGPNSVINNPGQIWGGPNSVFNNPGQILGGNNSVFHNPGQVLDPGQWRF